MKELKILNEKELININGGDLGVFIGLGGLILATGKTIYDLGKDAGTRDALKEIN